MSFRASVSYIAPGTQTIALPMMSDLSGNAVGSWCYHSHMRISPGTGTTQVLLTVDSRPGFIYSIGATPTGSVFPIPVGARSIVVAPSGGGAGVELGSDR